VTVHPTAWIEKESCLGDKPRSPHAEHASEVTQIEIVCAALT
jgi:hypothetical protein